MSKVATRNFMEDGDVISASCIGPIFTSITENIANLDDPVFPHPTIMEALGKAAEAGKITDLMMEREACDRLCRAGIAAFRPSHPNKIILLVKVILRTESRVEEIVVTVYARLFQLARLRQNFIWVTSPKPSAKPINRSAATA